MKRLPDSELEVMQAIWSCEPPVSRAEIDHILKDHYPIAPTTLLTLLTRLAEKGFIKIEKVGRNARYIPLIKQDVYLAKQSKRFFDQLCKSNLSVFANALCQSGLTKEDIATLRELLDEDHL